MESGFTNHRSAALNAYFFCFRKSAVWSVWTVGHSGGGAAGAGGADQDEPGGP